MAYFRNRGFRDDIIEKFQLGYCTESHDAMAQEAIRKGFKKETKLRIYDNKKAPVKGRGQPKCFHNGIILIVIRFK